MSLIPAEYRLNGQVCWRWSGEGQCTPAIRAEHRDEIAPRDYAFSELAEFGGVSNAPVRERIARDLPEVGRQENLLGAGRPDCIDIVLQGHAVLRVYRETMLGKYLRPASEHLLLLV